MSQQCIAACADWLLENTQLPPPRRDGLAALGPQLVAAVPAAQPALVGIAGAPGTGKTTLAGMLCAALEASGRPALTLSLDNYYLPAADRETLAEEHHPLFRLRGVPGTHDTGLLLEHIDALRSGFSGRLQLPRFNKSLDNRMQLPACVTAPPGLAVVFIEGWTISLPAQDSAALEEPVNELEREEDTDGAWRRAVNANLEAFHQALGLRLHQAWLLTDPGWDCVIDWRWRQEQDIDPAQRRLADRPAVEKFLAPFQRLCNHMRDSTWADLTITLDKDHHPKIKGAP
jgi:D-glycerate 3-kinase